MTTTVKLKIKTIKTEDPNEVEYAKTHAQIVRNGHGGYDLLFPTKLNAQLKPHLGKDFDMNVIVEDENTLKVILTVDKNPTE